MKTFCKLILIQVLLISLTTTKAQNLGEWVWVHGDSTFNNPGNFGVQGTPSPTNYPPGLYEACSWTDTDGNFWLFGGGKLSQAYNTMWKFDIALKQWVWKKGTSSPGASGVYGVNGVPAPGNTPGGRAWGVSTWTDLQGNFWLFGGYGQDGAGSYARYNDLWRFNPQTEEWTWMAGSSTANAPAVFGTMGVPSVNNMPQSLTENHFCWVDKGNNLWLYGGDVGSLSNDNMWKYSISTNEWTWVSGNGVSGAISPIVYGPLGVEGASYSPGSRYGYTSFIDPDGFLYLFGAGENYSSFRNDVWRYNPLNSKWAFWGGTNLSNNGGSNIATCDTLNNFPRAALEMRATWPDSCGFWVFGGYDYLQGECLNNLWYFNSESKEFTWASGNNVVNDPGKYGIKNVSASSNFPPARNGAVTWNDKSGNLWMFGGELDFSLGQCYNDLWMYTPDPNCVPLCSHSTFIPPNYVAPNECDKIFVPNVFTPDGDGVNDNFTIKAKNCNDVKCLIYNRWGILMCELNASNLSWDGKTKENKKASNGTYYYVLTSIAQNGDQKKLTGFLSLISE